MSKFIKSFTDVNMSEASKEDIIEHLFQVLWENKWVAIAIVALVLLIKWS